MKKLREVKDKIIYNKAENYLKKKHEKDINKKLKLIKKVLKKKDIKERYSYLYDLLCDYLDNEFKEKNICDFNCGICKKKMHLKEKNIKKDTYINGCCHSYIDKKDCDHLNKDGSCNVKCLGCKLFTCNYLKKQGYKYKLKNIYLSRYFFNYWQRNFIEYTFRKPKEYVLNGILKRRSRVFK